MVVHRLVGYRCLTLVVDAHIVSKVQRESVLDLYRIHEYLRWVQIKKNNACKIWKDGAH